MPMNRFHLYIEATGRALSIERKAYVSDTSAAIGMALSGKGFKKYMDALDGKEG